MACPYCRGDDCSTRIIAINGVTYRETYCRPCNRCFGMLIELSRQAKLL